MGETEEKKRKARLKWESLPEWYRRRFGPGLLGAHLSGDLVVFVEVLQGSAPLGEYGEPEPKKDPGNVLVQRYSVSCTEGELGYAPAPTIFPVSKDFFEMSRNQNWGVSWGEVKLESMFQMYDMRRITSTN